MVLCCQELVKSNKLSEKIFVIAGKVEEVGHHLPLTHTHTHTPPVLLLMETTNGQIC